MQLINGHIISSLKMDDTATICHSNFTNSKITIKQRNPTRNAKLDIKLNCGEKSEVEVEVTDAESYKNFAIELNSLADSKVDITIKKAVLSTFRLNIKNVRNTPITVNFNNSEK